ncbi:MAG: hypothetical protein KAT25_04535 [Sulfuriflexus sp.]|nr:hypothetical protein [Sulfuriflexus sp.]
MTLDSLTTFFGWCAIINIAVLLISTVLILIFKQPIVRLHSKLFDVNPDNLPTMYFDYLGNYKVATYVLSIVPYIALKVMA